MVRALASTAGGMGSIPGWGSRIPHAVWLSQKKNYLSVREGLIAISEIGMKILGPHSRGD